MNLKYTFGIIGIISIIVVVIIVIYKMKNNCNDNSPITVDCVVRFLKEQRKELDKQQETDWVVQKKLNLEKIIEESNKMQDSSIPKVSLGWFKDIFNKKFGPCKYYSEMSLNCIIEFLTTKRQEVVASNRPITEKNKILEYIDLLINQNKDIFKNNLPFSSSTRYIDFTNMINNFIQNTN